ncbi:MAG: BMP family ABC transporter substrate-binding protein [Aggregatilineales bacterium]
MFRKRIFLLATGLFITSLMLSMAAPSPLSAQAGATAATMAATAQAGALPAACGNTPGTVADIAAKVKADPTKKPKIGFLFVGPVDDFGYNYAANQGRLCLEAIWPGSTVYAENVPENAEAERVMEKMIQDGATIIYPTSYGHFDPATRVAKKYPNVTFLHMGGPSTLPNLGTFFGNIWQMVYLSGAAAAKMTKSGKLGYIVAFPIPQTLLNVNAFELGAQSVNPAATTTVVFTGSWCDPAKMTSASDTLIDQGIDVLTMHQDCPKPIIEEAARRGIFVVGYHADGSSVAPTAWITGAMWVWGPTMIQMTDQILEGTWKPTVLRYGPQEGIVDLAPFGSSVPKDVQDSITKLKAQVIAGTVFPFTGPIKDQNGNVVIADGVKPDEATLETMNYLVAGVIGTMPQ